MSVIAAPRTPLGRKGVVAAIGLGVAGALSVATMSNSWLGRAMSDGVSESIAGVKTVAAMLAERSPGERPEGALANLKPKRQAALHERALPKVRPASPAYEALAGPPPTPPIAPLPSGPLYTAVAGGPVPITPITGGATGGPPLLSDIPSPGGGGGGIFLPPVAQAAPETPPVPVTPVPEPGTWAMMILGFVVMARALRRRSAGEAKPAVE